MPNTALPLQTTDAAAGGPAKPLGFCLSCSAVLQGPFCHACGVKAPKLPLTLPGMWQDFTERVLHVEKSLKRTLGHLCWQPRTVFKTFLQGQRRTYTHPLPFLVAIATLCVLLSQFYSDAYLDVYRAKLQQQIGSNLPPARAALYAQLNVWLSLSMPYWMLIFTLPAAGLLRLAFPKRGFSVAEAWAVGLYSVAMAMLVALLVSGLGQWAKVPMLGLQLVGDVLLLLISVCYYLAWLGLRPWSLLRVVAACFFGFVLMNQLQELATYCIAAWLPLNHGAGH
jgi:hypothetical protein